MFLGEEVIGLNQFSDVLNGNCAQYGIQIKRGKPYNDLHCSIDAKPVTVSSKKPNLKSKSIHHDLKGNFYFLLQVISIPYLQW